MLDRVEIMQGTPAPNSLESLDRDDEVSGLFTMPAEDVAAFQFKNSTCAKTGVASVGTIDRPTPGFGAGSFPNKASSPRDGNAPGATSEGCGWLLRSYNGKATFALATPSNVARSYGLRDIPDPAKILSPFSELGQWMAANAAVQSDSDAVYCALLKAYLTPYLPEDAKALGLPLGSTPQKAFRHARGISSKCPKDVTHRKLGTYSSDRSSGAEDAAEQHVERNLPSPHTFAMFSNLLPHNTEKVSTAWWGHVERLGQEADPDCRQTSIPLTRPMRTDGWETVIPPLALRWTAGVCHGKHFFAWCPGDRIGPYFNQCILLCLAMAYDIPPDYMRELAQQRDEATRVQEGEPLYAPRRYGLTSEIDSRFTTRRHASRNNASGPLCSSMADWLAEFKYILPARKVESGLTSKKLCTRPVLVVHDLATPHSASYFSFMDPELPETACVDDGILGRDETYLNRRTSESEADHHFRMTDYVEFLASESHLFHITRPDGAPRLDTMWKAQCSFTWNHDQSILNSIPNGKAPPLLNPNLDLDLILEDYVFKNALVSNGPYTPGKDQINSALFDGATLPSRLQSGWSTQLDDPNGFFRTADALHLKSDGTFDGQRFSDKAHAEEVTTLRFRSHPVYGHGFYDHLFLCLRLTCRLLDRHILALFFPHFYMPWPRRISQTEKEAADIHNLYPGTMVQRSSLMNGLLTSRGQEYHQTTSTNWQVQFFTLVTFFRRTFTITTPLSQLAEALDITRWNTTPAETIQISLAGTRHPQRP